MAESARRKKLEKTSVEPSIPSQKCYCYRCGLSFGQRKNNFPVSHSPMYRGIGFLPVCNDCIDDMHEQYVRKLGDEREAMRRICMKFDLYWDDELYEMVARTNGVRSRVRNYIGKTNIIRYLNKTFDDTLTEEELSGGFVRSEYLSDAASHHAGMVSDRDEKDIFVNHEIIDFWGEDFAPEFYLKLDKRYKRWTDGLGDLDNGTEALYKQICILEETINKDIALGNNKAVDKYMNTLNTLLGSANLKPTQKKSAADNVDDSTPFGVWIDRWEHKRPIPDPDPAFQDVDGIIKYITTWFYGHISKALGIKNIYCEMYEQEIEKMKVSRPELAEENEDDDESFFNAVFGNRGG